VKAFATQSDAVHLHPTRILWKSGAARRIQRAGYRLSRFPSGVTHHVFKACFATSPLLREAPSDGLTS